MTLAQNPTGLRVRVFAIAAVCLLAASCATGSQNVSFLGGYYDDASRSAFHYAGAGRDFETVIIGNPFDAPKPLTDRAVLDAMRGNDKGLDINFTPAPGNFARPFRIVMAFNPDPARHGAALCGDRGAAASPAKGGRITLAAAFCDGSELQFAVGSSAAPMGSPQDPAFRRMVSTLMYHFVPFESMIDEPDEPEDDN